MFHFLFLFLFLFGSTVVLFFLQEFFTRKITIIAFTLFFSRFLSFSFVHSIREDLVTLMLSFHFCVCICVPWYVRVYQLVLTLPWKFQFLIHIFMLPLFLPHQSVSVSLLEKFQIFRFNRKQFLFELQFFLFS